MLAARAPRVEAGDRQQLGGVAGERTRVPRQRVLGDLGQPDAADPRRRPREVAVDELA
jgi:hypothetical protein